MSAVDRRLTLDESASAKEVKSDSPLFLDELQVGVTGIIFVMLSKRGGHICIKNFVVHPNKEEYRIRKDDAFMLEFNGATSARKSLAKCAGFVRHPFQLVKLDSVELTNNKYMIDVVGYIANVGKSIQQRTGSRTLDFYLANERGQMLRVTLWGGGDTLIEKKTKDVDKLYLSSSSSTQIFDDSNIPTLKELRSEIRARNGWNFPTCGGENCKKGVGRKLEGWWCDACEKAVEYPVLRYRLELGISNATAHVVVVMFDDTAFELVKCSADSLAQSDEE
ncbi:ATP-dependent DNA helicase PIF1-like protein, partial [Tanacetum coccineum]